MIRVELLSCGDYQTESPVIVEFPPLYAAYGKSMVRSLIESGTGPFVFNVAPMLSDTESKEIYNCTVFKTAAEMEARNINAVGEGQFRIQTMDDFFNLVDHFVYDLNLATIHCEAAEMNNLVSPALLDDDVSPTFCDDDEGNSCLSDMSDPPNSKQSDEEKRGDPTADDEAIGNCLSTEILDNNAIVSAKGSIASIPDESATPSDIALPRNANSEGSNEGMIRDLRSPTPDDGSVKGSIASIPDKNAKPSDIAPSRNANMDGSNDGKRSPLQSPHCLDGVSSNDFAATVPEDSARVSSNNYPGNADGPVQAFGLNISERRQLKIFNVPVLSKKNALLDMFNIKRDSEISDQELEYLRDHDWHMINNFLNIDMKSLIILMRYSKDKRIAYICKRYVERHSAIYHRSTTVTQNMFVHMPADHLKVICYLSGVCSNPPLECDLCHDPISHPADYCPRYANLQARLDLPKRYRGRCDDCRSTEHVSFMCPSPSRWKHLRSVINAIHSIGLATSQWTAADFETFIRNALGH